MIADFFTDDVASLVNVPDIQVLTGQTRYTQKVGGSQPTAFGL